MLMSKIGELFLKKVGIYLVSYTFFCIFARKSN